MIRNKNVDVQGEKVNWMKVKALRFSKYQTSIIFYKNDPAATEWKQIDIRGTRSVRRTSILIDPKFPEILPNCYKNPIPISKAKYDDLQKLCTDNIIPEEHWEFYKELPFTSKCQAEVDDSDEGEDF